jgi:hypothetical protein
MAGFLTLDIGDVFTFQETITAIDHEYYINGIEYEIYPTGIIKCKYIPELRHTGIVWRLGVSAFGIDTVLGY